MLLATLLALLLAGSASASGGKNGSPWQSPLPQASGLAAAPSDASSDTTPPTTIATGADALWHNRPVTVTLTATDNPGGSGVASITYSVDGGSPTTVTATTTKVTIAAPADHSNDGSHTLSFYATDNAANAEAPQTVSVKIDTTPPTTTASGADARWHNKPVTVTFAATDSPGGSGIALTEYSLDSGASWTVASALTIAAPANHTGDSRHTILYRSADIAGNWATPQSLTVKIDTRPPRLRWLSVKPAVITSLRSVRYGFLIRESSGAVAVSLNVYDQYGVRVLRRTGLRLDPGLRRLNLAPRYASRRPFMPGLYRLQLTVTDQAGNRTTTTLKAFRDELPVKAAVWRDVPGAGRRVALTFDDGYDEAAWASILATLHAYHEQATFFVNGRYVVAFPAAARRTVAWGNAIGSHTWSHVLTTTESPAQIRSQVELDVQAWWRVAGATPLPYFRPPYGGYDATTLAVVGAAGFARVMLWSVDPSDYTDPGSGVIAARVLSEVRSGAIVELHLKPQTAAALPAILHGLRARHYKEVSLPALFHAAGYR